MSQPRLLPIGVVIFVISQFPQSNGPALCVSMICNCFQNIRMPLFSMYEAAFQSTLEMSHMLWVFIIHLVECPTCEGYLEPHQNS